ncbi:hypothetical protein BCR39DRAFT_509859 [Naematelia encephala]|uniref:F-box domain-containing protein n=1 Tax=Naematelia encephala TaxID=71784 RepID=A0A1Y2BL21_9TREE|nr:hypothetical protein BCR39DRAFT_509859 [Naematelia encephala]
MRSSVRLMRVCKSWRKEASAYLYATPCITATNLPLLTEQVVRGDKKWTDIHLHPYSTPGRWIQTLDLSHLTDQGFFSPHPTTIARSMFALSSLCPNLKHLVLPLGAEGGWEEHVIRSCARGLKALEGVHENTLAKVLRAESRCLKNLQVLSFVGAAGDGGYEGIGQWNNNQQEGSFKFDKLHTLILHNRVNDGPLLDALVDRELPQLKRLVITAYHQRTRAIHETHGNQLLSLTFLPPIEYPIIRSLPPLDTLDLHPQLLQLGFLLYNQYSHLSGILARAHELHHPLHTLTITNWTIPGSAPHDFLADLVNRPPPHLKVLNIDGYRWVNAELGRTACMSGVSGEKRVWAERLAGAGIEVRDCEGRKMPCLGDVRDAEGERGRRRASFASPPKKRDQSQDDGG